MIDDDDDDHTWQILLASVNLTSRRTLAGRSARSLRFRCGKITCVIPPQCAASTYGRDNRLRQRAAVQIPVTERESTDEDRGNDLRQSALVLTQIGQWTSPGDCCDVDL
jgi:hypothetical protein